MKMNSKQLTTMRTASHLLPDPGGEVARELIDEIERLKNILKTTVSVMTTGRPGYLDASGDTCWLDAIAAAEATGDET